MPAPAGELLPPEVEELREVFPEFDFVRLLGGVHADGVVIVPRDREQEVLQAAWDKVHAENVTREAVSNGMGAVATPD